MPIYGFNKKVACKPTAGGGVETSTKKGFATVQNKTQLLRLEVVFGEWQGMPAGSFVYVRGDSIKLPWGVDVFTVNDKQVILVPVDQIQLIES